MTIERQIIFKSIITCDYCRSTTEVMSSYNEMDMIEDIDISIDNTEDISNLGFRAIFGQQEVPLMAIVVFSIGREHVFDEYKIQFGPAPSKIMCKNCYTIKDILE